MKYVSNPNVVAYWEAGGFALENFEWRRRLLAPPVSAEVLHAFQRPREVRTIAQRFPDYSPASIRRTVAVLMRDGFLLPARPGGGRGIRRQPATAWPQGFSAAYYHFANRDPSYAETPGEYAQFLQAQLAQARQPPRYKTYPGAPRIDLPDSWKDIGGITLADALRARRTVREFVPRSVPLRKFAAILQGTWGQTGWVDGGMLGRLVVKTSPSAGARHPIECYVVVWRVEEIPPGLYHYSVKSGSLERLRRGNPMPQSLRLVAGCDWIREALSSAS